ncbi:MAG: peptidase M22 [Ruminococcaceae bacterium]|nr:peptidase M22 [Oscillospiraceae bacterium]
MSCYLGIDTSNYTTSLSLFSPQSGIVGFQRRILKVKDGEVGLRQRDAVFQHVQNLPQLMQDLYQHEKIAVDAIGVSVSPRDEEGSYMPCFTVGKALAESMACAMRIPVYHFSHQCGHIAAAAFSANREDLLQKEHIAFHVSGGTTEAVLVQPDLHKIIKTRLIASSLDLKAGQAVDRVGQMLHLPFPAGRYLEDLAGQSNKKYKIKPFMRDGSPSLSGLENKCRQMLEKGGLPADIAAYCLAYIAAALRLMAENCVQKYPDLPILFSGGVMSDLIIRDELQKHFDCVFSDPFYSSDNAAGIAYLTYLMNTR